jgi:hypothetical protein
MFKHLILATALLFTAGCNSYAKGEVEKMPVVPAAAEQVGQYPTVCPSGLLILRYDYELPGDETVAIFKEPNKLPRVYIRWDAKEEIAEAWIDDVKFSNEEGLRKAVPSGKACDVFTESK